MDILDGPSTPQALRLIKLIARPLRYLEDYEDRYGVFLGLVNRRLRFM